MKSRTPDRAAICADRLTYGRFGEYLSFLPVARFPQPSQSGFSLTASTNQAIFPSTSNLKGTQMVAPIKTRRFYQKNRVSTELRGAVAHSIFQHKGGLLAQRTSGAEVSSSIMAVSNTNTVMSKLGHAGLEQYPYTPYGRRPAHSERNNPMAFNGEQLDWATGGYLLGSYRLFSPTLKRFCSPDNLSPFEKGGLNTYAYCAGDPVNRTDSTGHAFTLTGLILLFAGAGMATVGTGFLMQGGMKKDNTLKIIGATLMAAGSLVLMAQGARFAKSKGMFSSFRNRAPRVPGSGGRPSLDEPREYVMLSNFRSSPGRAGNSNDLPPSYQDATHSPPTFEEAIQWNRQQPGNRELLHSNNNRTASMQMQMKARELRRSSS